MTNAKILIVLDDDADAARLEKRLTDLGYAVCATLSCGQQAIENIAVLHPDLALIDLALAGSVHGIEVAQQLGRQIPVIYLTRWGRCKPIATRPSDPTFRLCAQIH